MADPVSWFVIEPGWEVVDRDGQQVGRVEETIGDSTHDIFDGLSIAPGVFGSSRYVPAEQVAEITEGRVRLSLDRAGAEALAQYREPPTTARIEPDEASVVERLEEPLEAPIHARKGGAWRAFLTRLRMVLRRPQR